MPHDEKQMPAERRAGQDRRRDGDARTEVEKKIFGERRSSVDRRSGLNYSALTKTHGGDRSG